MKNLIAFFIFMFPLEVHLFLKDQINILMLIKMLINTHTVNPHFNVYYVIFKTCEN